MNILSPSFDDDLVGSSGLEPPTSCLSGTRSNLLSYEPVDFYSTGTSRLPLLYFLTFSRFRDWWR